MSDPVPGATRAPTVAALQLQPGATSKAPAPDPHALRNIVLFSDGTGNSSGKLQKTNVWRLYEALDLGPVMPGDGKFEQIAYYDDGVGTSSFTVLAMLGGVFGFGLARNIRDIYKFVCRNYRPKREHPDPGETIPADRIYAFGFSRGAYTIRLLVSLIARMGVVRYRDMTETQLRLCVNDMWREFRRGFHTNNFLSDFGVATGRALSRLAIQAKRRLLNQQGYGQIPHPPPNDGTPPEERKENSTLPWWGKEWWTYWRHGRTLRSSAQEGEVEMPDIEFVGVWDTVAAYGGPLVEITRAIDEFIWPLTMPDYGLNPKVKLARHALAIDDKRDAFHPLLWDEVQEAEHVAELAGKGEDARYTSVKDPTLRLDRLRQVWFAGMHADVGGGYSDESLSYVSLWWMIQHAEHAGVRLIGDFRTRIDTVRNSFGPLHDSRGGADAFYRYQPRYIGAWIDFDQPDDCGYHVLPATQIFRDPTIDHGRYVKRGQLREPIWLHPSVEQRLHSATDGYAPNNLPLVYRVDPGASATPVAARTTQALPQPTRARFARSLLEMSDRIKLRRFWYFVSLWLVLLIALKPFWPSIVFLKKFVGTADVRVNAQVLEASANAFLPTFASRWTHALAADPITSGLLIVATLIVMAVGVGHERDMADVSRQMWQARFAATSPPERPRLNWWLRAWHALARFVHTSDRLQRAVGDIKWRGLPLVLGAVLWLAIVYAGAAALTQVWLLWKESHDKICVAGTARGDVDIGDPCADLGVMVAPSHRYHIRVEVLDAAGAPADHWLDGGKPATPEGWLGGFDPLSAFSKFFRRVVDAPLMAPVLQIRSPARVEGAPNAPMWFCSPDWNWCDRRRWRSALFGDPVYMIRPTLVRDVKPANVWEGDFVSPPQKGVSAEGMRIYRKGEGAVPTGRLFFFVNDAVFPVDPFPKEQARQETDESGRSKATSCTRPSGPSVTWLDVAGRYHNNCGRARVTVELNEDEPG